MTAVWFEVVLTPSHVGQEPTHPVWEGADALKPGSAAGEKNNTHVAGHVQVKWEKSFEAFYTCFYIIRVECRLCSVESGTGVREGPKAFYILHPQGPP